MIVTLLDFILLCIAVIKYMQKQYLYPVVIFAFFVTNGFIISFGGLSPRVRHVDFALLQMLILSLIMFMKNPSFFNLKRDFTGKIILVYTLFFLFEFIRTVIKGFDTFSYALLDIRFWFIPFSYFIFRVIDPISFYKAGKVIFIFTVISSIFYIVQYLTHIELINTYIGGGAQYRMQITPAFLEFFILYMLFSKRKAISKYKFIFIPLFLIVLYLSQNRTPVITIALLVFLFLAIKRNSKNIIIAIVGCIIVFPIFSTMFEARSVGQTSLFNKDAIKMVNAMDYKNLKEGNTFFFRIAILLERAEYLIDHPDKALLGVGAIHEDSPRNKFNFITGTLNSDGSGRSQLHSIDIMWCSPLIQYGFLGVSLIIFIITYCIKLFYKSRNDYLQMITFLIFVGFFIQSFSSNSLRFSYNLFFLGLMLAYNSSYNSFLLKEKM